MTTITSAIENHFEGPEKTLEIDWVPNVGNNSLGLRAISRDQWDGKFKLASCFLPNINSGDHRIRTN